MPIQPSRYPPDWKEISRRVREEAGQKCQFCGVPNGTEVTRAPGGFWAVDPDGWHNRRGEAVDVRDVSYDTEYAPEGHLLPIGKLWRTKIVLTVAHLGPNKHNKQDCSNLKALCQSCHLAEDADEHAAMRRKNRERKQRMRQPLLPGMETVR